MHNLTRYSAKDCYFKACLLFLANDDTVGADNGLTKYSHKDPSFETSREAKLIRDLLGAIRAEDTGAFETVLFSFNKITPLDRWKTKVLLKAKGYITREHEDDFS